MDKQIRKILNIGFIMIILSASTLSLLPYAAATAMAAASYVQFSSPGDIFNASPNPVVIPVDRFGNTSAENITVVVQVISSTLPDDRYAYDPTVMTWDVNDTSSRNLSVIVPVLNDTGGRQTITFSLLKVEGTGDVGYNSTYRMDIDFPGNASGVTPTPSPEVTISPTAAPNVTMPSPGAGNITLNGTQNNTTTNASDNSTSPIRSKIRDTPVIILGGLVSLLVVVAAGYLLLFKRK